MLRIVKPLFDIFYPVGSYYETSNLNFKPNTNKNWFGEWVEDSKGYTTVAHDPSQIEFDTVGKKIGEKYHKLTIGELAWHNHPVRGDNLDSDVTIGNSVWGWGAGVVPASGNNAGSHLVAVGVGGDQPHNNIQPSVVVKRWHRIA